ncbi:hypothetical protein ACIBF5_24270 [Micromonospora sp. NPDC050417]|uniref:hypothetical protein n=1 Tax=Micromonospora sp. NPDC050417 TaxID=3364280 RepID=UPI0037A160B1
MSPLTRAHRHGQRKQRLDPPAGRDDRAVDEVPPYALMSPGKAAQAEARGRADVITPLVRP